MSNSLAPEQRERLDGLQRRALVVGAVALIVCVIGCVIGVFSGSTLATQFFRAYLAAYMYCLGVALGSLVILMIYHLTGGAWGYIVRRILEATTRTIPLLAILFVPVACGVYYLYLWTDPAQVAGNPSLQYKQIYLNLPFFFVRAVLYFVLWSLLAYFLNHWSRAQDRSESPVLAERMQRLSGPGLVVYGISLTFAAVDWVMSLQPAFHSTIFGPLVATSEMLSALSFTILVMIWLSSRSPLAEVVSPDAFRDHGNLLLTFLILWAYMVFFQFMLIWIANLPYEVIWYLPRSRGGWQWVTWALFIFALVVPFFSLLMREVKENPRPLAKVAWLLLFMQLVFVYYLVVPNFPDTTILDHWMDFLTPLGVGGLWLAYFLYQLKQGALLPLHDLSREAALHLREVDAEEGHQEEEAARA
jgi:hypothetical protein